MQRAVNRSGLFNLLVLSSLFGFPWLPSASRCFICSRLCLGLGHSGAQSYALARQTKNGKAHGHARCAAVGCSICSCCLASLGFPWLHSSASLCFSRLRPTLRRIRRRSLSYTQKKSWRNAWPRCAAQGQRLWVVQSACAVWRPLASLGFPSTAKLLLQHAWRHCWQLVEAGGTVLENGCIIRRPPCLQGEGAGGVFV